MTKQWGPFTRPPNLLILLADQQRTTQHMPAHWVRQHLPHLWRLMQTGVSFSNAMTNASPCSPSRSVLWTSTFPQINGVVDNAQSANTSLQPGRIPGRPLPIGTLAQMLASLAPAGVVYDIAYKGKWHLTYGYQGTHSPQSTGGGGIAPDQQQANGAKQASDNAHIAQTYGFSGWTSPDFGTAVSVASNGAYTLGQGLGGNDDRVVHGISYSSAGEVENARQFLTRHATQRSAQRQPYCLIASLCNPHDVWVAPVQYRQTGYSNGSGTPPWQCGHFLEISLPATFDQDPSVLSGKPAAQLQTAWHPGYSKDEALDYLRFYAYIETLTDALLGELLDALGPQQRADTLIVRLADHGEMGMAQGGMVEKENQAYNETLLVPMVFSHPGLPQGESCAALAGLIDIVPTLAEICGLAAPGDAYLIQGRSLAPTILAGAAGVTYHQHLFTNPLTPLYALVEDHQHHAKYVVTANGTGWQCELYDFRYDPGSATPWPDERSNLIPVDGLMKGSRAGSDEQQQLWRQMHLALSDAMLARGIPTPSAWPEAPPGA